MARTERGYTLVELVVVMAIFSVVMGLIAVSFNRIVSASGQVIKAAETDIGGLIGLELFRSDLEIAGFGLPYSVPDYPKYQETTLGMMVQGKEASNASGFNDVPPLAPRAYLSRDGGGLNDSDYLVLKGTPLGMNATCRSWSYLSYRPGGSEIKLSKSEVELKPNRDERVVVLRSSANANGVLRRQLVTEIGDDDRPYFTLIFTTPLSKFQPRNENEVHLLYGVAPEKTTSADQSLLFPYNRADYYIDRPADGTSMSRNCAKNTGLLYKVLMSQNSSDGFEKYPLLDCVADMQVVFSIDTNGNGDVDRWVSDFDQVDDSGYRAAEMRDQLKEVRVYILAQQGKKDRDYRYPLKEMPIVVADPAHKDLGSVWTETRFSALDPEWRQYHWKVYTIVVQPKNL